MGTDHTAPENEAAGIPPARLPLLDGLRLFASIAVVRHHMRGDHFFDVAFGVPLFLVIMLGLAARSSAREGVAEHARRKAALLLVPWVRWSLVYLALAVCMDAARGLGPTGRLEVRMLFYGGHGALWFLPFAVLALSAVHLARRGLDRAASKGATPARWNPLADGRGPSPARLALALALLAAGATCLALRMLPQLGLAMPFDAWLCASPAVLWGLAVGRASLARSDRDRWMSLACVAVCALAAFVVSPRTELMTDVASRFALGVPLACLGFAWRPALPRVVHALATLTFGVYLTHPLVAKLLATLFDVFAWPLAMHVTCVWMASAVLVLALRRLPMRLSECWSGARPPVVVQTPNAALERKNAA